MGSVTSVPRMTSTRASLCAPGAGMMMGRSRLRRATDHAICGSPPTAGLKNAQTYKQQMEDLMKKQNKQIVETGWKYTT